jgi:hypothetical protein
MKKVFFLLAIASVTLNSLAQTKSDIWGNTPITWLGLDFTQLKFIGSANQFKDAGTITASDMRNKYFPAWNNLFITEQKKYDVAGAVNRDNVSYATDVTDKANGASTSAYFTDNPDDYQLLSAEKISALISHYDFKGKTGLGLLFFVEGMSKDRVEASMWVTFVNMGSKTVLLTKQVTGAAGGFGFRNYWAKTFLNVLNDIDLKKWKKS